MPRLLLFLLRRSWLPTVSYAKYAIKGFKETRIYSFTEEATICHGNSNKGPTKRLKRRFIFAQRRPVFTMIHRELSVTSPVLKSITVENTVRRNGSVRNVPRNMQFNPTGKLTLKLAALESINVTVAHYFPGIFLVLC